MLEKIIQTLLGRVPVTERTLREATRTLVQMLLQRRFSHVDQLSEVVRTSLVQEAFRRVTEGRSEGRAPIGAFCSELESTADAVVAVFAGNEAADPRIKGILEFHGVGRREPNQAPQRNAGSSPTSGDSPTPETPSSLGPRG